MNPDSIKTPESHLSSDPGDDIQSRFRYQGICAALYSLSMLDENTNIESLYCEHYEDILIKMVDGKYIGIQVKTRNIQLGPFTANDDVIVGSLCGFVKIEKDFPGLFFQYTLTSNCGFWGKKKNNSNLNYIINIIKECKNCHEAIKNQDCAKIFQKINESTGYDEDIIFETLRKVKTDKKPDRTSILCYLMKSLTQIYGIENKSFIIVKEIANALVNKMINAASLTYKGPREGFYVLLRDPNLEITNDIIQGKKITKSEISTIINDCILEDKVWYFDSQQFLKEESDELGMELKLQMGGITDPNIKNMKVSRNIADEYFAKWRYKYSREDAVVRYRQVKFIVYNECLAVYDSLYNNEELFGQEMLNQIRNNLRERFLTNKESVFGMELEILQGVVGILTDQCHIWWSKNIDRG